MKTLAMLAMVVCLGRVRAADAVVTGSIFGPGSESFPIAVVPLKNVGGDADGSLGTRFARVLSRDLDLSGYFRLLDPKTFIEDPQTSGPPTSTSSGGRRSVPRRSSRAPSTPPVTRSRSRSVSSTFRVATTCRRRAGDSRAGALTSRAWRTRPPTGSSSS